VAPNPSSRPASSRRRSLKATRHRRLDGIVPRPFAGKGLDRMIALLKRRDATNSPATAELLGMLAG